MRYFFHDFYECKNKNFPITVVVTTVVFSAVIVTVIVDVVI